jgi:large subunit ribosomal protein L17
MRHQKKRHKLGRTASHRRATLAAMAAALIEHKRIETTLTKAKALRTFVEPIITRAKEDTTHNRREAFRHLRSKEAVKELFGEVAGRVGDRPGGYTRVIRLGNRVGDSAEMAVIELVDWNDVAPEGAASSRKKTRRGGRRRSGGAAAAKPAASGAQKQQQPAEEAPQQAEPAEPEAEMAEDAGPEPEAEAHEPAAHEGSTGTHDAPKTAADPEVNMHPDAAQGADPGTGSPPPEAGKGDQGVAGGSRHRG